MSRQKAIAWFACLVILLATGAFLVAARAGLLTPSEADLQARYSLPASKFLDIDGQIIHYTDEGHGDAVVLIHGSFGSLRNWQDWASALTPDYRVISFDLPGQGLSGPSPDGRDGVEQHLRTVESLSQQLQLGNFVLAATSSGGEIAAAYAAQYPRKVRGLILSNIAVGPFAINPSHFSTLFKLLIRVDPLFNGWHSQLFWREILRNNFARPERVTAAQIAEWTDLNNRAQRMPPRVSAANDPRPFARTPDDLALVQAPTLLLWSANDAELPVETVGETALKLLGAKDKQLSVVPDCGHMMPLECGPESAQQVRAFLAELAGRQR